ncbi:MAG: 5'-nucleotidase C-terminal domain-containing protein [Candidatus Bipolaricaulota bacterium]
MNWKLVVLGLALGLLVVLGTWDAGREGSSFSLTILHTNDVHSHYVPWDDELGAGAARLATRIREVRAERDHTLLLDAGDQFQGTLPFVVGGAEMVAEVMNALGYDAMTVGNHEFDRGPEELARLAARVRFPLLSANVTVDATSPLGNELLPYDVFLFGDEVVAVVGLTTADTAFASSPGPSVHFSSAVDSARAAVRSLEEQGVRVIVALTHLGYAEDLALAACVAGLDVIVGGHSHTVLSVGDPEAPYPTIVESPNGEPVVVVTAGEWGTSLGRLDVTFRNGTVRSATGQLLATSPDVAEAEDVRQILRPYEELAQALLGRPVGETDEDLDGEREAVRSRETSLGNAIADAMRWKTAAFGTEIAVQNGGGIRASIPRGEITMGQILAVLPFGNAIAVLELRGDMLTQALENGLSQVESQAGRFPQVSGLRLHVSLEASPGSRVLRIEVWDPGTSEYAALDSGRVYRVATNDFLAGGGDGYSSFAEADSRYDTGWLMSDALAEYFGAGMPSQGPAGARVLTEAPSS